MNKFFVAEGQVINLEAVICAERISMIGAPDQYAINLIEDKLVILRDNTAIKNFQAICLNYKIQES